jgi:xanthine dehydrogenase small subunit
MRLTGTKVVCAEGDCGSCSVLIGRSDGQRINYRAVDSCIQFVFQLDGTHIVTVEGLSRGGCLTPVQQAMVHLHGSQCGFCTPGFVVAMTGILETCPRPDSDDWRHGLTGNLCRCTGYVPILDAARHAATQSYDSIEEIYPSAEMCAEFRELASQSLMMGDQGRTVFSPVELQDAIDFLSQNPSAKVVAGATDVGVQANKQLIAPDRFLDLNRVGGLDEIEIEEGALVCGARANWTDLENVCRRNVPEFSEIVSIFGSPQIRHVGTIGGNIINASPIADSVPFLYVAEALLEIVGPGGSREVNINDFYQGYRKTCLQPQELLTRIRIPLPSDRQRLALFKVSRRRDLDIATFTAAILLETEQSKIVDARIAFGAVAPTVIRARMAEQFLRGKPFNESIMRAAGEIAMDEVSPISDVRGSADFRYQLTRNVFLKFFHQCTRNVA